jgi:UDP-N-acetylglucosamine--N-acetylmuramyl-(pentapeptide) pyrophosphoryl-undecaprenol N-acetylglucosamine transferase
MFPSTRIDRLSPLVLIAAGGTGGHIFPGLAVAEEIARRATGLRVAFVGSTAPKGLEGRIVPKAGHELHLLPVLPLNTPSLIARLRGALLLPWGLLQALALLIRTRPSVVLGIGGYASGPLLLVASLLRIPTVVLEPNAIPGFTNRVLKPFVRQAACAFESTLPFFQGKGVLTGNPVRSSFQALPGGPSAGPFQLLCFGGSQGSRILSEALVNALPALPGASVLAIVHQTGPAQHEAVREAYRSAAREALVVPFIDDMAEAFASADLVLCRAGATTIAELTVAGKAAILVPLKSAADDHQTWNARALHEAGAAIMLEEKDLEMLGSVVSDLATHPERVRSIESRAKTLGKPDAASKVTDLLTRWVEAA